MTIVFGLYSAAPEGRGTNVLAALEREIDESSDARTVLQAPGFMLRRCGDDGPAAATVIGTTSDGVRVAVVGRPAGRDALASDIAQLAWSAVVDRLASLDGYWIALGYHAQSHRLEVVCDRLGVAWLYWARVPGGVALSSDFGALARSLPAQPRLDDTACLLSLTMTYPLGDATCFEAIRVVSPGEVLQFSGDAVASRRHATQPAYGDRFAGAPRAAKFEALDAILDASYRIWSMPDGAPPWAVALSAGNDSRYGLGVLLRHGQRPACATFGLPGSHDVQGATAVCRREGLAHTLFTTDRRTSWDSWRAGVQRLGVVAGYQYGAGWAHDWRQTLGALGGQVVLGFLGDALSGSHLVDRTGGDWLANWTAWSLDARDDGSWPGADMLRPEWRGAVREVVRNALEEASRVQVAFAHQKALHLDLLSRQRRITASQINFLTDAIPVAPLLYTSEMVEFWSNLEYADMRGQALYLAYARDRFPRLFAPPRRPSLYRRARGVLVNFVAGRFPDLKRRLAPPEIDVRALQAQHVERLRSLLDDCGEAIDHIVDTAALAGWLDRFDAREGVIARQLQRYWNLLLLVEAGLRGRRERSATAPHRPDTAIVGRVDLP